MAEFFVRRPIVAIVIAIITMLAGLVSMRSLPEALDATPEVVVSAGEYRLVGSPVNVVGYQPDYRSPPALDEFGEAQS